MTKENVDLSKELYQAGVNVYKGTIPCSAYFLANSLIRQQGFHKQACKFQEMMRACGYDVKRDVLSDKLIWNGGMINDSNRSN